MRTDLGVPVPQVQRALFEWAVEDAVRAPLVRGLVAIAAEPGRCAEDGGSGRGRAVGYPVPVEEIPCVSALLEGLLVQGQEVAMPREEGGYIVDCTYSSTQGKKGF